MSAQSPPSRNGVGWTTMIFLLEDDYDLLTVLSDVIKRGTGREVLGLRTLDELRDRRQEALRCRLGILDVNLGPGQPSGLDAYAWLRAERYGGRIAFLTGHATTHPMVARAQQMGQAEVLRKPLDMRQLIELVG